MPCLMSSDCSNKNDGSKQTPARRPYLHVRLALGIAAVSFGGILIRLAGEASPLAIAAWRLGIAALVLVPLALLRREQTKLDARTLLLSIGSGIALALHFVLWISSLRYTTVASSVLFVSTHPIFVGIGSHLVLKERVNRTLAAAIVLSALGGLIVGFGDVRLGGVALRGNLLALGGGMAVSVYFLIGRRVRRTVALLDYVAVSYGTAAILVFTGCLAARCPLGGFSSATYLYLSLLALGPQLLGHSTFNWALKHLPASKVSVLILGEPIGASILALLFFGEIPSWLNGVGAAAILIGIYLSLRSEEESNGIVAGTHED